MLQFEWNFKVYQQFLQVSFHLSKKRPRWCLQLEENITMEISLTGVFDSIVTSVEWAAAAAGAVQTSESETCVQRWFASALLLWWLCSVSSPGNSAYQQALSTCSPFFDFWLLLLCRRCCVGTHRVAMGTAWSGVERKEMWHRLNPRQEQLSGWLNCRLLTGQEMDTSTGKVKVELRLHSTSLLQLVGGVCLC